MQEKDPQIRTQVLGNLEPKNGTNTGSILICNVVREENARFGHVNLMSRAPAELIKDPLNKLYLTIGSLTKEDQVISKEEVQKLGNPLYSE